MTTALSGAEMADKLKQQFPGAIAESTRGYLSVKSESLVEIVSLLKNSPEFSFDYLSGVTAVDYFDYFEVVYHLTSLKHNHSLMLKTRCYGRENPSVPSLVRLYRGADFQEREVYDLMGIRFEGHPNLKRIVLWEGFQGYPLRKDYL